jgi:hypothetical protein
VATACAVFHLLVSGVVYDRVLTQSSSGYSVNVRLVVSLNSDLLGGK